VTFWCAVALVDGLAVPGVRILEVAGVITAVERAPAEPGDVPLGTVLPGMADAHSHVFHRALRGRTHGDGGDFWRWRERMYAAAAALDPALYRELATAVFAELLVSGWTAVGEFHYLHHTSDGSPYPEAHAMERAVIEAACDVGIRLTLLDTLYLAGGVDTALSPAQRRFGDASAAAWVDRWTALRELERPGVTVGAAFHSVRAAPRAAMATALALLPADLPLHVHLSEQPAENADCLRATGLTPTGLLHELGALTPRLSVVHATHLTDDDVALLGTARVTVVMCPTTEADLGDGIGPARRLADAGCAIALGSDQNAVADPFLEARGLEYGERLASGTRGRFSPRALGSTLGVDGYASLGQTGGIAVGAWCDLVEVDAHSRRTVGSAPDQLWLSATASDVRRVIVGGRVVAADGLLADGTDPARLLGDAVAELDGSSR
jgi:formiminoglutamate deiminase